MKTMPSGSTLSHSASVLVIRQNGDKQNPQRFESVQRKDLREPWRRQLSANQEEAMEETQWDRTWNADFWPAELLENRFPLVKPSSSIFQYGNPGKLVQMLPSLR